VGYLVAHAAWTQALERAIRATTWSNPGVMSAMACAWIEDGTVARLEQEKRADARQRQALARELLTGLEILGHPGAYFLWLPLPEEVRADQVAMALLREKVSVSTAEPFVCAGPVPHAIRLALGSVSLAELREALLKVRRVIARYAF
ncbi:aminotransferase class I/II-fold pyridoxal phosphate-dependent enzyme, partial [Pseudomonas sp. KCJK8993]|uniref:aminotransferase class I/II-fold pyridoxal phosphate-dependent enzyme n=1 Tax=Pseudomonas sp. KCJK8993 TaxID=3344565 RepID=UPI003906B3C6